MPFAFHSGNRQKETDTGCLQKRIWPQPNVFFLDTDEAHSHDQPPNVAEWMQCMERDQWGSLPLRQWENIY